MATEEEAMPPIVRPIPLSLPPTDILPLFLPPTVRPTLRGEGGPSSLPHSRSQREQFQHCSRLANVHPPPPPPPALKNFLGAGPFRGEGERREERRAVYWPPFLGSLSSPLSPGGRDRMEGRGRTDRSLPVIETGAVSPSFPHPLYIPPFLPLHPRKSPFSFFQPLGHDGEQ